MILLKRLVMKTSLLIIASTLLLLQLLPAPKLPPYAASAPTIDSTIDSLLAKSCFDCHSRHYHLPWYSAISPLKYEINSHIVKGIKALDFDNFNNLDENKKEALKRKIAQAIKIRMPLPSYLWLHGDAKLSAKEKNRLKRWATER